MRYGRTTSSICITLIVVSTLIIILRWKHFLSGLKIQSADHLIASLYLILLFLVPIAMLIFIRSKSRQMSKDQGRVARFFDGLTRRKLSFISIAILFTIGSAALLSPVISPSDPNAQPDTLALRYLPPLSKAYIIIRSGGAEIYANEVTDRDSDILYRRSEKWESIEKNDLLDSGRKNWLKEKYFILGTDKFGRDILSRIIYGSRVSLMIGILAVLIATTLGSFIGSVSGFSGPAIDSILMRIVDIMFSFPRIFLILLIVALFKPSLLVTIAVLGATGWMGVSRLVRSQTLSLREADFVKAAQAMGQKRGKIILKHLIPNTSSTIIVDSTMRIGNTILIEASLSFLGLGVQPPMPSWGSIISDGRDALLDGWWISAFPGLALVITVVMFNILGDSIREFLSPRSGRIR